MPVKSRGPAVRLNLYLASALYQAEIHHKVKRRPSRDDRAANLVTLCGGIAGCHRLYDDKVQWSKK